jgi:hypothetical protein
MYLTFNIDFILFQIIKLIFVYYLPQYVFLELLLIRE